MQERDQTQALHQLWISIEKSHLTLQINIKQLILRKKLLIIKLHKHPSCIASLSMVTLLLITLRIK